jgi:GC-rich sequence DNA-binding factor
MIAKTIIPRVCKLVESGAFDPYSSQAVRRLLDLSEQVEASVAKENPKFLASAISMSPSDVRAHFPQALEKALKLSFEGVIVHSSDLVQPYLALHNPRFDPEAIPARRRFLARRVKLVKNIVRWRKYTGELFGIGDLITKLVNDCMLPIAESGWDVGGEEVMREVRKPRARPAPITHELAVARLPLFYRPNLFQPNLKVDLARRESMGSPSPPKAPSALSRQYDC